MHEALRTEYDGNISLFVCLECSFRMLLDHRDGTVQFLDRGIGMHWGAAGVKLEVDDH